jgi:hypothetical protein
MEKATAKGHIVSYDLEAHEGIRYLLYQIDAKEAKVFFDEAYNHGFAAFEDHLGYRYKLIHHGGEYQLIKL